MNDTDLAKFGQCIMALDNGFVFYADTVAKNEITGLWVATGARCIRRWGTTGGLAQLVNGPTNETELDDAAPSMSINDSSVLFFIPCTGNWK